MIRFLFFLLLINHAWAAPKNEDQKTQQYNVRLFKRTGDLNLMLESITQDHLLRENEQRVIIGGKYRLHPNFKIAAFIGEHRGARETVDWQKGKWVKAQNKTLGIMDFIARSELPYLNSILFELRTRIENVSQTGEQTLKLRGSLYRNFFLASDAQFTLMYQNETYYAQNFGDRKVYAFWNYFSLLWHFTDDLRFGPFVGRGKHFWTNDKINSHEEQDILGLNLNIYL